MPVICNHQPELGDIDSARWQSKTIPLTRPLPFARRKKTTRIGTVLQGLNGLTPYWGSSSPPKKADILAAISGSVGTPSGSVPFPTNIVVQTGDGREHFNSIKSVNTDTMSPMLAQVLYNLVRGWYALPTNLQQQAVYYMANPRQVRNGPANVNAQSVLTYDNGHASTGVIGIRYAITRAGNTNDYMWTQCYTTEPNLGSDVSIMNKKNLWGQIHSNSDSIWQDLGIAAVAAFTLNPVMATGLIAAPVATVGVAAGTQAAGIIGTPVAAAVEAAPAIVTGVTGAAGSGGLTNTLLQAGTQLAPTLINDLTGGSNPPGAPVSPPAVNAGASQNTILGLPSGLALGIGAGLLLLIAATK